MKKKFEQLLKLMNGICVFDIDKTLTSPACKNDLDCQQRAKKNALKSIQLCKDNNMGLAYNTARSAETYNGIPREIKHKMQDSYYCHRKSGENVLRGKLRCMNDIKKKYNFNGKDENIILFDDRPENHKFIQQNSKYSTFQIDELGYGIYDYDVDKFQKILAKQLVTFFDIR